MARIVTRLIQDTERSTRLWMMLAFIAGMVFTVVLVQTIVTVNAVSPGFKHGPVTPASSGDHDSLVPDTVPDIGYIAHEYIGGLVHARPG
jgi:hypothetical protein